MARECGVDRAADESQRGRVNKTNTPSRLDAGTARKLAVEASCDPRTIVRVHRGEDVRGIAGQRAREVLIKHGLLSPTDG